MRKEEKRTFLAGGRGNSLEKRRPIKGKLPRGFLEVEVSARKEGTLRKTTREELVIPWGEKGQVVGEEVVKSVAKKLRLLKKRCKLRCR